jgi:hypothetical protein
LGSLFTSSDRYFLTRWTIYGSDRPQDAAGARSPPVALFWPAALHPHFGDARYGKVVRSGVSFAQTLSVVRLGLVLLALSSLPNNACSPAPNRIADCRVGL